MKTKIDAEATGVRFSEGQRQYRELEGQNCFGLTEAQFEELHLRSVPRGSQLWLSDFPLPNAQTKISRMSGDFRVQVNLPFRDPFTYTPTAITEIAILQAARRLRAEGLEVRTSQRLFTRLRFRLPLDLPQGTHLASIRRSMDAIFANAMDLLASEGQRIADYRREFRS
jgi:hypothetical protein